MYALNPYLGGLPVYKRRLTAEQTPCGDSSGLYFIVHFSFYWAYAIKHFLQYALTGSGAFIWRAVAFTVTVLRT